MEADGEGFGKRGVVMRLIRAGRFSLLALAGPVFAQTATPDEATDPFAKTAAALTAEQPALALDDIAPVVAAQERRYATEKRRIYCNMTLTQTLSSMGKAAVDKVDAVAVDSDLCRALYLQGFALVDLGRMQEAEAVFERLVKLAPFNARYVYELANVRRTQKKYDEAMAGYREAADLASLAPDGQEKIERGTAWRQIGWIYVELGKLDEGEAMYRKCLDLDPYDEKAKIELEYIAEQRKKK
jgi:tetratricopeptide (TPR) repeat protein